MTKYETFRFCGVNHNHMTVAIRSTLHPACNMNDRPRWSIHLMIWGDFGPWEHYWSHCGQEDKGWWNWLEDTDRDYWLGKMVGRNNDREFDFKKSQAHVISEIIRLRREGVLDKEDARTAYDDIGGMEGASEDLFIHAVGNLTYTPPNGRIRLTSMVMFDEFYEMTSHRTKPNLVWFWDNIWRPFITKACETKGFT